MGSGWSTRPDICSGATAWRCSKTLPMSLDGQPESSRDAERLHRFRREFRSLSDINHPNLVGMQTLEVDGGQWFFTMDLIDGVDFIDYVRRGGQLDEARLRKVVKQLVRGIMALHECRGSDCKHAIAAADSALRCAGASLWERTGSRDGLVLCLGR